MEGRPLRGRSIALVCAAALLLCGGLQPGEAAPAPAAESRELTFVVDSREEAVFQEGAALFAEQVTALSGGLLTVRVQPSVMPQEDYEAERAQLCFLDSQRDRDFCRDFSVLTEPLVYRDYDRFTMGLNSARMLEALNDATIDGRGTRLLGAFYQGSRQLVSRYPLRRGDMNVPPPGEEEDAAMLAVLRPDSRLQATLAAYGMETRTEEDPTLRRQMLLSGEAVLAEYTVDELLSQRWSSSLYLLQMNHSMVPRWLGIREEAYESLTERQRAVLAEACSYLYPVIDGTTVAYETGAMRELAGTMRVETGFDALLLAGRQAGQEVHGDRVRRKYLLDIIDQMA